jgi:hypothetical protein
MASRRALRFLPLRASNSSTVAGWPMSSRKTVMCKSRRQAPYRFSATGFLPPLPEPDLRLSFRIRLSRRHGEVRLPQPGEAVPADWRQGEQKLLC